MSWLYAPSEAHRRRLQRLLFFFCGVGLLAILPDLGRERSLLPAYLALRVVWVLCVLATALYLPRASALGYQVVVGVANAAGVAHLAGLALLGGGDPATMAWLVAYPLANMVVAQDDVLTVASAALASVVGAVAASLVLGRPGVEVTGWGWSSLAGGVVAVYGSSLFRRLRRSEREEQEGRTAALRRLAESEARRSASERLAVVGRLAAGVAHEVNNPLVYAMNNIAFARAQLAGERLDRAEVQSALAETNEGLVRIASIVRDLRTFSRAGAEEAAERTELCEVVEEALRLSSVRLGAGVQVRVEVPAGLPPARMARQRLSQVLVNLLVNAADALEGPGGKSQGRVAILGELAGERLRLSVEDDGPGIPQELLPRLFEPFFTTKPPGKGTGLGLALSREYLEQAGGTIGAENRPGGGCRFTLELRPAEHG